MLCEAAALAAVRREIRQCGGGVEDDGGTVVEGRFCAPILEEEQSAQHGLGGNVARPKGGVAWFWAERRCCSSRVCRMVVGSCNECVQRCDDKDHHTT